MHPKGSRGKCLSLVNYKIIKIEETCAEADAASTRNNTREHFSIVKKLNGESPKTFFPKALFSKQAKW